MAYPGKAYDFTVRWPTEAHIARRHAAITAGRFIRELLGITQAEAAEQIGVYIGSVKAWENGKSLPALDVWPRYRRWLLEVFASYVASQEHAPAPDPALFVGSSVLRERLGLKGHCERCLEQGHRAAHPKARCVDVGCDKRHEPVRWSALPDSDAP